MIPIFVNFQLVQFIVILITIIVGIYKLRNIRCPERDFILVFTIGDLIALTGVLSYYYHPSYDLTSSAFSLIVLWWETFMLSYYISSIIGIKKAIILPAIICISSLYFSKQFFNSDYFIPEIATSLYLSYFIYRYFKWLFNDPKFIKLSHTAHYWIVMGIFLSYSITLPIWFCNRLILESKIPLFVHLSDYLFILFVILNCCMYLLFIEGFIMKKKYLAKSFSINHYAE